MAVGLDQICLEVLLHIFSFLTSARDLCHCSLVCRRWNEALDEREGSPVWKNVLEDLSASKSFSRFLSNHLIKELSGSKAKLVAFENAWNSEDCSKNIELKDNQLVLHRKPIAQSTDAIRGKRGYIHGQHYWKIRWHRASFGSSAVVGVATEHESLHREGYCPLLGSTAESWGWDVSKNVLRHNGAVLAQYPTEEDVNVSYELIGGS